MFNFGYVGVERKKYTVMPTTISVNLPALRCSRVGHISTPEVPTSDGEILGIAPPDPEAAFNVRMIDAAAAAVAAYR